MHVLFSFQPSLVLAGPFSSPFTLVHLFARFIFIFPSLPQNSCAPSLPPSVCLSLSLRLSLPLYLSPVSSSETSGAKLCLSLSLHFFLLFFFASLSKSVTTFFFFCQGCLILRGASKREEELIPNPVFPPKKEKKRESRRFFKKKKSVQLLVLTSCPNRVSVRPALRHPGGVNEGRNTGMEGLYLVGGVKRVLRGMIRAL